MIPPSARQMLQAQVERLERLTGKKFSVDSQYGGFVLIDERHNNVLNSPYLSAAKISNLVEVFTKGIIYMAGED